MRTHAVDSTMQKPLSKWPIKTCFNTTQQYLTRNLKMYKISKPYEHKTQTHLSQLGFM